MMSSKVAYSTGFWCTNIGNSFFGLGVEFVLKQILGRENVTVVSDYQTYTTGYGKRLYPHKNQMEYISKLDVDCVVLAGPVISKYFLPLWKDILVRLKDRGIRYSILSAGMMKMTEESLVECQSFFERYPPYILCTRDQQTFDVFGKYADHAYDGVCFSFFAPDYYAPSKINERYFTLNFDKINEPVIWTDESSVAADSLSFMFENKIYHLKHTGIFSHISAKTDRFSDALVYASSMFPQGKRGDKIGDHAIFRTDHRFHPHFRRKIYGQSNSFCADIPYGYLNIYANSDLTLSDRVHACAVTMAYGHPAMLFAETKRVGLLERVGAGDISQRPVSLDLEKLEQEKQGMVDWLKTVFF